MFSLFSNTKTNKPDIKYNYGATTIYKSQYTTLLKDAGYVELAYIAPHNIQTPNLTVDLSRYTTERIYITKKTLVLDNIDYDGELFIEHSSVTNSGDKMFSCILLKTMDSVMETTMIDKLINQHFNETMVLDLNPLLSFSTVNSVTNNLCVFTTPILISSRFDAFTNVSPISHQWRSITLESGQQIPIVEGAETMTCTPIDDNGDDIDTIEMVPYAGNSITRISGAQTFLAATIGLILSSGFLSIFVPPLYRFLVMNIVEKATNGRNLAGNLKAYDMFVIFLISVLTIVTFVIALSTKDATMMISATSCFIVFLLITIIMIFYKRLNPELYSFGTSEGVNKAEISNEALSTIFDYSRKNYMLHIGGLLAVISGVGFSVNYGVNKIDFKDTESKKRQKTTNLTIGNGIISLLLFYTLFGLPVAIYAFSKNPTT
jgi:hypothetical protein